MWKLHAPGSCFGWQPSHFSLGPLPPLVVHGHQQGGQCACKSQRCLEVGRMRIGMQMYGMMGGVTRIVPNNYNYSIIIVWLCYYGSQFSRVVFRRVRWQKISTSGRLATNWAVRVLMFSWGELLTKDEWEFYGGVKGDERGKWCGVFAM